jgi:hypothetical protein
MLGLMMRYWNTIASSLFKDEVYAPLLVQDEDVSERTRELTHSSSELRTTQSELSKEKDRLKVLLDFTNRLLSTVNIRDSQRMVLGTVGEITESAFVGIGLPDPDKNPYPDKNEDGFDFIVADDSGSEAVVTEEEKLAVRIFRADTIVTNTPNTPGRLAGPVNSLEQQLSTVYSLPLLGRDRALGILVAGRHDEKAYCFDLASHAKNFFQRRIRVKTRTRRTTSNPKKGTLAKDKTPARARVVARTMVPSHLRSNLNSGDVRCGGLGLIPGPLPVVGEKVTGTKRKDLNK